jgi:WXG100 family type VII secretion target
MSKSVVDTAAIQSAAADINRLKDTIQQASAQLRSRLGALDGAWEGPAKIEFTRVMHDYQGVQGRLNESLDDIARVTSRASAAYLQHEDATRALFAR